MPFGGWFNCEYCGLKGDSIRVYQQVYQISSLLKLRKALEEEFRSANSFDEDWGIYQEFYEGYYGKVEKLWKASQYNASNYGQPYHARRLHDLDMWRDQDTFNRHLADSVGMVHRGQLVDILGEAPQGVTPKQHTRMLIVPYYWVPGFISGFALVGNRDQVKHVSLIPDYFGGFTNLTNKASKTKTTILLDSPMQILRSKLKFGVEGVEMPVMVSPYPGAVVDWGGLHGDLVYWHDNPTPENLRKYLSAGHCKIITTSCPPEWGSDHKRVSEWEVAIGPSVARNLNNKRGRKDVLSFCVSAIFNKRTQSGEYIERLNPSQAIAHLLMTKCVSHQKKKLKRLLEDINFTEMVHIKGKLVYEKQGKWWIRNRKAKQGAGDEVISEAILVVDTIYRNSDMSTSSCAGRILYKSYSIQFVVNTKELEKNPRDYIELVCSHAGIETLPYIADWGKGNLVKIAELFRAPEVVKIKDTVGFDTFTGRFYLPKTLITPSRIEVGGQYVCPTSLLPGAHIGCQMGEDFDETSLFNEELLSNWMNPHHECIGYWATVAAFMYTLQAKMEDRPTTGIALVGGKGSLAEYLFNIFRYDLDLLKSDLSTASERSIALGSSSHDLPLAIDGLRCARTDLKNWLDKSGGPNTLLLLDPLYASSLGPDPDWVFIRAEAKPTGEDGILAGTESAIPFIIQYTLITQPQSLESAFEGCVAIAKKVNRDAYTVEQAKRISSTAGYINSKSELANFLGFVDELGEQGALNDKDPEIKGNKSTDKISIDVDRLQKAARRAKLHVRHWDLRNQLIDLGFTPVKEAIGAKYTGSFKLWGKLMTAIRRLKNIHRLRGKKYSESN